MEADPIQYALISLEMSWTKSFLHVHEQGHDYLDKPPLLFWLSSLSFLTFGASNFSYKLPSLLIAILGIYSTYRFSKLYYSKEKSITAALILASTQALFLMTNDVRTDTNLLGLTIFSIWQIAEYLRNPKFKHLLLSGLGIGFAMMAKGPIALVIPAAAFGTEFLLKRQWKNILKPQWILLLVIIAISLLPMCYGLYTQFDLHPEKFVYGLQGPSGLKFFFWTQSFGRITGENYWQNDTGYTFFFQTILWDFQPWILFFIPALAKRIWTLIKNKFRADNNLEYITLGGFVLMIVALSLSKFKLPHYIFVLFPFAAIITADFIFELKEKWLNAFSKIQFGILHLFWVALIVLFTFVFPVNSIVMPILSIILFIIFWFVFIKLKNNKTEQIITATLMTSFAFNVMLSLHFYPSLLSYQSGSQVGKFVKENNIANDKFYHFEHPNQATDFYAERFTPSVNIDNVKDLEKGSWIVTSEENYQKIKVLYPTIKVVKTFPSYKVSLLNLEFLNNKTRQNTLKIVYIVEI
jgi:4-amino-4-deoxy-L-arabinose transferase-like glycosyltransferase